MEKGINSNDSSLLLFGTQLVETQRTLKLKLRGPSQMIIQSVAN